MNGCPGCLNTYHSLKACGALDRCMCVCGGAGGEGFWFTEWGVLDDEPRKEGHSFVSLTRYYSCFSCEQCLCPEDKLSASEATFSLM